MSAELTYVAMYALYHLNATSAQPEVTFLARTVAGWLLYLCIPGCIMKQIVNVFQLTTSCNAVAKDDALKKNKSIS